MGTMYKFYKIDSLNGYLFDSSKVKVIPNAYRSLSYNAEARLNTEYNLTHLGNTALNNGTFIVSLGAANADSILACYINGYYFEITFNVTDIIELFGSPTAVNDCIYLIATTKDILLNGDTHTKILGSFVTPNGVNNDLDEKLDQSDTQTAYFKGLLVSKTIPNNIPTYSLKILNSYNGTTWELADMSKLPPISHGNGKSSIIISEGVSADGKNAVVLGNSTVATNENTISAGTSTLASGKNAISIGNETEASGSESIASGIGTVANHRAQHVFGAYNIIDLSTKPFTQRGTYIEIVGNGNNTTRSNARTLDWDGNEVLAGSLEIGNSATIANTLTAPTINNTTLNTSTITGNSMSLDTKATINDIEVNTIELAENLTANNIVLNAEDSKITADAVETTNLKIARGTLQFSHTPANQATTITFPDVSGTVILDTIKNTFINKQIFTDDITIKSQIILDETINSGEDFNLDPETGEIQEKDRRIAENYSHLRNLSLSKNLTFYELPNEPQNIYFKKLNEDRSNYLTIATIGPNSEINSLNTKILNLHLNDGLATKQYEINDVLLNNITINPAVLKYNPEGREKFSTVSGKIILTPFNSESQFKLTADIPIANNAINDEQGRSISRTYGAELTYDTETGKLDLLSQTTKVINTATQEDQVLDKVILSSININNIQNALHADAADKFYTEDQIGADNQFTYFKDDGTPIATTKTLGNNTTPVWLNAGVFTAGTSYAGATQIKLNNVSKAGEAASFYAPLTSGNSNNILISKGTNNAPEWQSPWSTPSTLKLRENSKGISWTREASKNSFTDLSFVNNEVMNDVFDDEWQSTFTYSKVAIGPIIFGMFRLNTGMRRDNDAIRINVNTLFGINTIANVQTTIRDYHNTDNSVTHFLTWTDGTNVYVGQANNKDQNRGFDLLVIGRI